MSTFIITHCKSSDSRVFDYIYIIIKYNSYEKEKYHKIFSNSFIRNLMTSVEYHLKASVITSNYLK